MAVFSFAFQPSGNVAVRRRCGLRAALLLSWILPVVGFAASVVRHDVATDHPRLLGSRAELQALSRARAVEYRRVVAVARGRGADNHAAIISQALVAAIEGDRELGRRAIERALMFVDGPIRKGHATFGHDLALSALAFDLCFEWWTEDERARFISYFNRTVDANVTSENAVFHNGWYGYKNWGIGLAGYASYHENPRSPAIIAGLEVEFRARAAPALELAGAGGGWAEGYYIHYWLYEWLFFCEVARRCEGVDYYALAPKFFSQRAIASMFEMYPGIGENNSRRPVPMGDGGGRTFGGDRDKVLSARRILVNYFRDDPAHQVVHAFNETTPRSSVGNYAYMDFLWHDPTVKRGDLGQFKRSHVSTGPGHVYARSSWAEDATYFFFKASDRFTSHQHLDAGHFDIFRREELAGDGGHYEAFGSRHDVNYHLRTIAHSTLLVLDPAERWPGIRAGTVTGNDGGQHHAWPNHNGGVTDVAAWQQTPARYDIADLVAFNDTGDAVYVAADLTRAYAASKVSRYTRQIVFLRPGTFLVFDRVTSTRPEFKKTWLLQSMTPPEAHGDDLVITNGQGRLFVQTVLPATVQRTVATGEALYAYDGQSFPPEHEVGVAPRARIEVSPREPNESDLFLHVLTATDATVADVPRAVATVNGNAVEVQLGDFRVRFRVDAVGGELEERGEARPFPGRVIPTPEFPPAVTTR